MRPETIGLEIAKRSYAAASGLGLRSAHYPAPGVLPELPTLIVLWDTVNVSELNEQILMLTYRGLLFTSLEPVEEQITAIDPLVVPIIDAFSPNLANRVNYRLTMPDGDGVDYCRVESAELSIPISYNEKMHYGGRIRWGVKLRRFAGAS